MKRKRSKESLLVASSRRLVEAEVGLLDVVDFIEEVEVGAGFEESFHGGVVVEAVEAESAAAVVGVPAPREEREVLVQRAEIGLEHRRCEEGELRRRRRLRKAYVVDEGLQDLEGRRGVEGEVLRRNLQPGEDAVVDGRLRRRRQQAPVVGMSYRFAAAQIHKNRAVAAGELGSLARRDHRRPLLHRVEHRPRHLRRVAPAEDDGFVFVPHAQGRGDAEGQGRLRRRRHDGPVDDLSGPRIFSERQEARVARAIGAIGARATEGRDLDGVAFRTFHEGRQRPRSHHFPRHRPHRHAQRRRLHEGEQPEHLLLGSC
mmetsp:Transcript_19096/g.61457  ORF Transcript_19096/g.61457 Transcript_19096/m.61457 type:complete len:315 (-) Transcript_19096:236-1180(-)